MSDTSLRTAWFAQFLTVLVTSQATMVAVRTMTSYRALELGAGGLAIGLLAASFALVPLLVAVAVGRAVDGQRAREALRLGTLLSLAGAGVLVAAGTLWQLALGNILSGLGVLVTTVALQGVVAHKVADAAHDRAFGLFFVALSIGQLLGPLLATLASRAGADSYTGADPRLGLAASAVMALVGVVLVVRLPDLRRQEPGGGEATGDDGGQTSVLSMVRTPGMLLAVLASSAVLSSLDILTAFLPVFAEERGISVAAVGLLLALRAAASIVSRLIVSRLVVLVGRQRLLFVSMTLGALSLAAVTLSDSVIVLGVLLCVAGFLLGIGQPLTMTWVAALVSRRSRATALAVRLTGNRVGQVLLPVGAGLVAASAGASAVFLVVAGLLAVAGAAVAISPGSNPYRVPDSTGRASA